MDQLFVYGGVIASIILILVGVASVVVGAVGRSEVQRNLERENIVGTPDSRLAGQKITTGSEAKEFAEVIRKHTLEITGGQTYSEMPRYLDAQGQPTNDQNLAAKDPKTGKVVDNPKRQIWVTATALTTALNTSYFAERVALFSVAVGVALVLTGIGFLILTVRVLRLV